MYLFFFGILVFKITPIVESDIAYDSSVLNTSSSEVTYAYLVEDNVEALAIRVALIETATETIDISTYSSHPGESRDIIYGSMLVAADNGIKVRYILDDFIEGRLSEDDAILQTLAAHENITLYLYQPFKLTKPHATQNRLHDKLFIIDQAYGLIGGRNIGDRYFVAEDSYINGTYDRDVLVFGEGEHSTVKSMVAYYEELVNSRFSRPRHADDSISDTKSKLLNAYHNYTITTNTALVMNNVHLEATQVERATFLRSPLTQMKKDPVIMNTLIDLADDYNSLLVQTPYLIIDRHLGRMFSPLQDKNITILTNSYRTNPNVLAVSGYLRIRQDVAEQTTLYEYQGMNSIHAKTILMGDDISVIGTLNIDPRSAFLSTESMMVIYSEAFYDVTFEAINHYIDNSLIVEADGSYQESDNVVAREITRSRNLRLHILKYVAWFFNDML